ncbi:MAG TPA: hypothetical protein VN213_12250 [Solirubrobacteraceae bacterium]|nr:hypothetical protein [Solirubrobacteraceae bacterium]
MEGEVALDGLGQGAVRALQGLQAVAQRRHALVAVRALGPEHGGHRLERDADVVDLADLSYGLSTDAVVAQVKAELAA